MIAAAMYMQSICRGDAEEMQRSSEENRVVPCSNFDLILVEYFYNLFYSFSLHQFVGLIIMIQS